MHLRSAAVTLLLALVVAPPAIRAQHSAPRPEEAAAAPAGWLEARWTRSDLVRLASAVSEWRRAHGAWPDPCPGPAAATLQPPPERDAWGTPFACLLDGDARIVSAGADRAHGTSDDLTRSVADDRPDLAAGPEGAAPPAAAAMAPAPGGDPLPARRTAVPASTEALRTVEGLSSLASALESFRARQGHYPVTDRVEQLQRWLVPEHLADASWSPVDGWGNQWRYRTTDVGSSYSLASAGSGGRWEALAPLVPGPVADDASDLVVVDGRLLRHPAGLAPFGGGERRDAAARAPEAPAAPPEPRDPHERTLWRMQRIAERLERESRSAGRFLGSDDAPRLVRELGGLPPAVDAWGRDLEYLSLGSGRSAALVSVGPDGRLARSMEAYAAGAEAAGDDILVRPGARKASGT